MIAALYNYCQSDIHSAEFSDEFNKLCIPFEDSLSEEQIDVFHKLLDCVSETADAEMRAAYKVGFNDDRKLITEIQEYYYGDSYFRTESSCFIDSTIEKCYNTK